MKEYYTILDTKENGVEKLGWITAQNQWNSMEIAKKIARNRGLTYKGSCSSTVYLGD